MSDYDEDPGEGSSRAPRADSRTLSAEAAPTPGRPPKLGANIASVSYLDEKIDRSRDQFRHGIEEINTSLATVNRRLDQFDKMSNDMAEIKTFMATLMREKADNSNGNARTPPPPRSGDPRNLSPRQDQPDPRQQDPRQQEPPRQRDPPDSRNLPSGPYVPNTAGWLATRMPSFSSFSGSSVTREQWASSIKRMPTGTV